MTAREFVINIMGYQDENLIEGLASLSHWLRREDEYFVDFPNVEVFW